MPKPTTRLVGRSSELELVRSQLEFAIAGQAGSLVLSGDAGVGKTRLLGEVSELADRMQMTVLVGHCLDFGDDAGLPYLPFTEAFGRLDADEHETGKSLVEKFGPLSLLMPGRRRIGSEHRLDDRVERAALFEAVLGACAWLSEQSPVLLIIEDAHWADQATRDLLGFVLSRLRSQRLAVVVSYRGDDLNRRHPLRRVAAEWGRLPGVQRLDLKPLGALDVRALITDVATTRLAESQIENIVGRAEGNAFFVEELVAAAEQAPGDSALPAELVDLVLLRLERLSAPARRVVRVAAVAGRRVPHALLAQVSSVMGTELDEALREAVEAHVLEPAGERGYGFRHALLAEVTYDDLLPGERVRLHAGYVSALVEADFPGTAAELARHARESGQLAVAYRASVQAGDEAMALAAPRDAMRHFEAALALRESAAAEATPGLELVFAAADAAAAAGHQLRALKLAREALDTVEPGQPLERARVLAAVATFTLMIDSEVPAVAVSAEALRLVPAEPPSALRVRLAALHARACLMLGRDVEATRWANEALEAAQLLDPPTVPVDAQTTIAVLRRRAGDPDEAVLLLEGAVQRAKAAGEISTELRGRCNIGNLYYELGELDRAASAYRRAAGRAHETGRDWAAYGLDARALLGLVEFERGNWDASSAATFVSGRRPAPQAEAMLAAVSMALCAARGQSTGLELLPLARRGWSQDGMIAVLTAGPAMELLALTGDQRGALALHDEVVELLRGLWQDAWFLARVRLAAIAMRVLVADVAGQSTGQRAETAGRAHELVEAARQAAATGLPSGRAMGVEGIAWIARAEAEWARVRWRCGIDPPTEQAHLALWQASVDAFGYGNVYEQHRSRAALAGVLRAAGQHDRARAEIGLVLPFAKSVGAAPLLDELHAIGRASSRRGAPVGPATLTERERDVLTLLVEARTNRQIAAQLFISEKTVSVHVSNILAKLGVRSRAEAAAWARQQP